MSKLNKKCVLLFCFERENRYSIGALLHAIESHDLEKELIIEFCDFKAAPREFARLQQKSQKLIAALSFMTFQAEGAWTAVSRLLPLKGSEGLIIAGGPHAAALPEEALNRGADAVFLCEAEKTFPAFLKNFLSGGWQSSGGIAWRDDSGAVKKNPVAEAVDLDICWSSAKKFGIIAPLEITRGCLYACKYCFTPKLFVGKLRHRSVESAVRLAGEYLNYVSFLSPNAFSYGASRKGETNIASMVKLLSGIKHANPKLNINFGTFPSEVRPEYVSRELIREIKPLISNRYISIGLQSGSDAVLRSIAREHSVGDGLRAIEILHNEGLNVMVDLIFGLPGEGPTDVIETRRLIKRFISPEIKFRIHRFAPLPGTPFANEPPGKIDAGTADFLLDYKNQNLIEGTWE